MKEIKVTCIFQGERLLNLYVNSGYYPHKIEEEMIKSGVGNISVKTMYLKISNEELVDFLEKNSQ